MKGSHKCLLYLGHQPFRDMGADETSSTADANFDDPICTNLLGMLGFEVTREIVSHFAGQVCGFMKQEKMNSIVRKI